MEGMVRGRALRRLSCAWNSASAAPPACLPNSSSGFDSTPREAPGVPMRGGTDLLAAPLGVPACSASPAENGPPADESCTCRYKMNGGLIYASKLFIDAYVKLYCPINVSKFATNAEM